jgi:hypothetical protein
VFKQIGSLSILVEDKSVALFEGTPSGVMVKTDELLENDICKYTSSEIVKKNAIKQATHYIRAIGRIMLHALANRQTLPTNALPHFFINCESVIVFSALFVV